MVNSPASADADAELGVSDRAALIHREIGRLLVLIGIAVCAFLGTRALAASNRAMSLRDATESYERGERALANGDLAGAVDWFRRATVKNRQETRYAIALARALGRYGRIDAARAVLLARRQLAPEDREINLHLARLEAQRHDVTAARRYYQNALYAAWPPEQEAARRAVRTEFIAFLLAHGQDEHALSQLVAMSADPLQEADALVQLGELFLEAGDSRRALDQFQRALRVRRDDPVALDGAGIAAFRAGEYSLAWRYLRQAAAASAEAKQALSVVRFLQTSDPLAPRLTRAARRSRLHRALSHAIARLEHCPGPTGGAPDDERLQQEAHAFARAHAADGGTADTIEDGLDLVYRIERHVERRCGGLEPLDRALILIAERHNVLDTP